MTDESLKQKIQSDRITALKAKDKKKSSTISLLTAAIKQIEVDTRNTDLSDSEIQAVLSKMIKQRQDSIEAFKIAGRNELVEQEAYEIALIQNYLPEQLTAEEVAQLVEQIIQTSEVSSMKDMGKVMAELKSQSNGRIDMGIAGKIVKEKLG